MEEIKELPEWEDLLEEEKEVYKNKVLNLVDIMENINPFGLTILTGSTGGGKSMIWQQFGLKYLKDDDNNPNKRKCKSISMQLRTTTNSSWGALAGATLDNEWSPTSLNTFKLINGVFKAADLYKVPEPDTIRKLSETGYIILDEPEIGMAEETILALGSWLLDIMPILKKHKIGLMVITHSKLLTNCLYYGTIQVMDGNYIETLDKSFVSLDNLTIDEYLDPDRLIIPTDLSILKANYLFYAIRDRMNEVEQDKKNKK